MRKKYFLCLVIFLAAFLSFWKLGKHSLYEWDESRYGMIAYQMLQHSDFLNYYFLEQIDPTVYKPPMAVWAIAVSYKLFGINEFALRFPSAICAVVLFIFFFLWVCLYQPEVVALLSSLVLMGVKGIIGWHIGRTGDTDGMLVCFQMISLYHYSHYIDFNKRKAIISAAAFTALAFLTKGIAGLFFLPAFLIYAVLRKKIGTFLQDKYFWFAILSFSFLIGCWVVAIYIYGDTGFLSKMFSMDILGRITIDEKTKYIYSNSRWFIFESLDVRFNLWSYLFFLSIILFIAATFKKHFQNENPDFHISLLSLLIIFSIAVTLSIAKAKAEWYVAMIIPCCSVFTIIQLARLNLKPVFLLIYSLIAFSVIRNFISLNTIPTNRGQLLRNNKQLISNSKNVYWYNSNNEQDFFLYLTWYHTNFNQINGSTINKVDFENGDVLVGKVDSLLNRYFLPDTKLHSQTEGGYFILSKN